MRKYGNKEESKQLSYKEHLRKQKTIFKRVIFLLKVDEK